MSYVPTQRCATYRNRLGGCPPAPEEEEWGRGREDGRKGGRGRNDCSVLEAMASKPLPDGVAKNKLQYLVFGVCFVVCPAVPRR